MGYTLVCQTINKVGMIYDTELLSSSTCFDYANSDKHSLFEIPGDTDPEYIRCLQTQSPETIGTYLTDNYKIDFTSTTFISGYNRWHMGDMIDQRNIKLTESDWTQMNDSPLSDDTREAWRVYRQTLRDLPTTYNPETFTWPEPPQ
jgi:hypothetical protein